MKKITALLLVFIFILNFTACGKADEKGDAPSASKPQDETPVTDEQQKPEDGEASDDENKGVSGNVSLFYNNKIQTLVFKWPKSLGNREGTGRIGGQGDDTVVVVDQYIDGTSPEGVALGDFFPAYFEQTKAIFQDFFNESYSDGSFTVENKQLSTVNGYEVCLFEGKHSYNYEGTPYTESYVAYVTTLKANGGYVYWLVQDISEDQSNGELIREHADFIIRSVYEPQ